MPEDWRLWVLLGVTVLWVGAVFGGVVLLAIHAGYLVL